MGPPRKPAFDDESSDDSYFDDSEGIYLIILSADFLIKIILRTIIER